MRAEGCAGGAHAWLRGWPAGKPSGQRESGQSAAWRRLVFGVNPVRTLLRVLVMGTCSIVMTHHVFVPIKVSGASMTPTYRDGSVNFINRLSYARKTPKRGDVVILRDGDELILKRVIALPGEHVTLERGTFKINGAPVQDRFSVDPVNWDFEPMTLGANEYFVIGDNRTYSIFGKYERKQILGKIFF